MTDLIDLNHTRTLRDSFSASLLARVDASLQSLTDRPGRSVSASNIGDECARRVQYGIWPTFHPDAPPIKQAPIDGKLRRIFQRGNLFEPVVAGWLQEAGFDLITHKRDGQQFGFEAAGGQIKGFADGIIREFLSDAPDGSGNVLWECKAVGAKGWRGVQKHGVLKEYPKYDAQVQMLMAYLEFPATLFTFLNADTCELWFELTPFDPKRAQAASDRAVHILRATRAGELLPRAAADADAYPCRTCRFSMECWG